MNNYRNTRLDANFFSKPLDFWFQKVYRSRSLESIGIWFNDTYIKRLWNSTTYWKYRRFSRSWFFCLAHGIMARPGATASNMLLSPWHFRKTGHGNWGMPDQVWAREWWFLKEVTYLLASLSRETLPINHCPIFPEPSIFTPWNFFIFHWGHHSKLGTRPEGGESEGQLWAKRTNLQFKNDPNVPRFFGFFGWHWNLYA